MGMPHPLYLVMLTPRLNYKMEEKLDNLTKKEIIKRLIVNNLELQMESEEIGDETPLFTEENGGLGLDSVEALEVIIGLEEVFHIKVEMSDNPKDDFKNVSSIERLVIRCENSYAN